MEWQVGWGRIPCSNNTSCSTTWSGDPSAPCGNDPRSTFGHGLCIVILSSTVSLEERERFVETTFRRTSEGFYCRRRIREDEDEDENENEEIVTARNVRRLQGFIVREPILKGMWRALTRRCVGMHDRARGNFRIWVSRWMACNGECPEASSDGQR